MPIYHYECKKCGHDFEEQKRVDERYHLVCQNCGDGDLGILIDSVSVRFFEPYYDVPLGCYVKSRGHRKQVARGLGLTNVGDAKLHEIETIANENKRNLEKKERNKGPTPQFMEAWAKAKATIP